MGSILIKRDGQLRAEVADVQEAIGWLLSHQPQSWDWALRYEGWTVEHPDGSKALESYSARRAAGA